MTEPVDVVLVVTGRVLYVVGGPLYVCTVLCGDSLCWGASSVLVLMVVVEYTTRLVTLCACVSFCVEWDVIIFNTIERDTFHV